MRNALPFHEQESNPYVKSKWLSFYHTIFMDNIKINLNKQKNFKRKAKTILTTDNIAPNEGMLNHAELKNILYFMRKTIYGTTKTEMDSNEQITHQIKYRSRINEKEVGKVIFYKSDCVGSLVAVLLQSVENELLIGLGSSLAGVDWGMSKKKYFPSKLNQCSVVEYSAVIWAIWILFLVDTIMSRKKREYSAKNYHKCSIAAMHHAFFLFFINS